MMTPRLSRQQGFTLIELLIVIAIIAILALIAVPNFLEAQTRAKVSRVRADMRSLATGIEAYYVDFNVYPIVKYNTWSADYDIRNFRFFLYTYCNAGLSVGAHGVRGLTTPIAYFAGKPPLDPFAETNTLSYIRDNDCVYQSYWYYNADGAARAFERTPESDWVARNKPTNEDAPEPVAPAPMRFNNDDFTGGESYAMGLRPHYFFWALNSAGPDLNRLATPGATTTLSYFNSTNKWRQMAWGLGNMLYDPTNGTVSAGDLWRLNSGVPE